MSEPGPRVVHEPPLADDQVGEEHEPRGDVHDHRHPRRTLAGDDHEGQRGQHERKGHPLVEARQRGPVRRRPRAPRMTRGRFRRHAAIMARRGRDDADQPPAASSPRVSGYGAPATRAPTARRPRVGRRPASRRVRRELWSCAIVKVPSPPACCRLSPASWFRVGSGSDGRVVAAEELTELIATHQPQAVGTVGVADQQAQALRRESRVMVGTTTDAGRREIGEIVAATPAARPQVVDLQPGAARAARAAAVPVANQHGADDLG